MSITNTSTEASEQNSIVNSLIGQVTERFSSDTEPVQSDLDLLEMPSTSVSARVTSTIWSRRGTSLPR